MHVNNVIALDEVSIDIKIAELFYEKQNKGLCGYFKDIVIVIAVLDLRQNPKNIENRGVK